MNSTDQENLNSLMIKKKRNNNMTVSCVALGNNIVIKKCLFCISLKGINKLSQQNFIVLFHKIFYFLFSIHIIHHTILN